MFVVVIVVIVGVVVVNFIPIREFGLSISNSIFLKDACVIIAGKTIP